MNNNTWVCYCVFQCLVLNYFLGALGIGMALLVYYKYSLTHNFYLTILIVQTFKNVEYVFISEI